MQLCWLVVLAGKRWALGTIRRALRTASQSSGRVGAASAMRALAVFAGVLAGESLEQPAVHAAARAYECYRLAQRIFNFEDF